MPESRGRIVNAKLIGSIPIVATLLLNLLAFRPAFAQDAAEEQPPGQVAKSGFPSARKRIDHDVEVLSKESTEETLDRLSQVDMYFWPGVFGEEPLSLGPSFPVPSQPGERDVAQLIICRRLVKAYQNLAALPQAEATRFLNRQLTIALDEYKKMYQDYLRTNKPYFSPDKSYISGPSFIIGGTDKPTLLGYRLQVLGLVFVAGNLKLSGSALSVLAVARQASEDYERLKNSKENPASYRATLVEEASLYSRQALAVGLIGTLANPDDPVAVKYRDQMKVVKWPEFNARVTPADQPAIFGGAVVEKRPLEFRTFGELTDEDLAKIIAAATP